ncbi:hypothetical protein OGAPHI_007278 [Ogataea philodendri]|uniref:DNA replication checkpoint mediator MRC1 domain-containing protein n=1 Tax=Ogataea philodendri TaxID=1378263 RepID=A0A9P8NUF6_9ASCO|nr:uncharacterized protein OGAPHI_007278 [Ogataea philodendri]KAH3660073.1 hypothetical protein OGAPHI_007278 [Ogataea philodendri]
MEFLDELNDLPGVGRTFKTRTTQADTGTDFTQFSIFQNESTQVIESSRGDGLGLLGIDSGFIGAIKRRLNGETVEEEENDEESEKGEETEEQLHTAEIPNTHTVSLREEQTEMALDTAETQPVVPEEEEEEEEEEEKEEEDDLVAAIKNYNELTMEEKIQARVNEKRKRREQEEKEQLAKQLLASQKPQSESKPTKSVNPLVEVVKQNELIKKSAFSIKKHDASKFDPQKLVDEFMESDEETFSEAIGNTPNTSPKSEPHLETVEQKKAEFIELDSDSEDDLDEIKFAASKESIFEVRHRLSKRKRPPQVTLKNLIKEESRRQLQKLTEKRVEVVLEEKEDEIMKMLQEEIARNKKLQQREQEKIERQKREKERLLRGEISEDESEIDYDGEEEEEEEGEEEDVDEQEEQEEDEKERQTRNLEADTAEEPSQPPKSPSITFELDTQQSNMQNVFGPMSLSDAFDQTLPKKYTGMDSLKVMKDLGQIADDTMNTSMNETIERTEESFTATQSFQLGTLPVEEPEIPKTILESQNFLPDTQVDQEAEVEEEQESEDEVSKQATREAIREAKRAVERKRRAREKELRSKGLHEIMENEAEESEDEWKGMGGHDGEMSDEENSEDERMLNDEAIDVDNDKIRAALIKNEVEADDEMVKKIYKDIKTGAFRKRRARDGAYDLELSDDEDQQILDYYNRRRLEQQKQQMLQSKDISELAKDQTRKAFFDTIVETEENSYQFEEEPEEDDQEEESDEDEDRLVMAKKRKITREQVRSMISFLEDEEKPQNAIFIDDGFDEIRQMRENSVVLGERKDTNKNDVEMIEEEEEFGILARKSITSSFRKSGASGIRKVQEVNVTTVSKPAGDGRGAVTFLTKSRQLKPKEARIEQTLHRRQLKVRGGEWKS